MRKILTTLTSVLAGLLALSVVVAPAHAGTKWDGYSSSTQSSIDVKKVTVWQRASGWYLVKVISPRFSYGHRFNGIETYIDSRGDRRWEYKHVINFKNDGDRIQNHYLARPKNRRGDLVRVSCQLHVRARRGGDVIEIRVARHCLNATKKIGAQVRTMDYTKYSNNRRKVERYYYDLAPNRGYVR